MNGRPEIAKGPIYPIELWRDPPPQDVRDVGFEVKSVTDEGEFEGLAAVYDYLDQQGDVIERGAFAGAPAKVPILWQHDLNEILGFGELVDTPAGLRIRGKLNLAVARAREIYELMRQGVVNGLSIGYRTLQSFLHDGARHLQEIALHEVSLTAFPAQQLARVEKVKSGLSTEESEMQECLAVVRNVRREIRQMATR